MKKPGLDKTLIAIAAFLAGMTIITLLRVSIYSGNDPALMKVTLKQALWYTVGFGVMAAVARIPPSTLFRNAQWIYGLSLISLILPLFFEPIRGTRAWIPLGPVRFQPSEFAKIALILFAAAVLSHKIHARRPNRALVIFGMIVLPPVGLILLQPDLGTAITFGAVFVAIIYAAGLPLLYLGLAFAAGGVFVGRLVFSIADTELLFFSGNPAAIILHSPPVGVFVITTIFGALLLSRKYVKRIVAPRTLALLFLCVICAYWGSFSAEAQLKQYQRMRILTFVKPDIDPQGASYNVLQSMIAVGSGGISGRSGEGASQVGLGFLPEWHTDFIFAAVAETSGFIGATAVLGAFAFLIALLLHRAERSASRAERLVYAGLAALIAIHLLINVGMVLGVVPVIGIPLPLLSYGGSSVVSFFFALGILQSFHLEKQRVLYRRQLKNLRRRHRRAA